MVYPLDIIKTRIQTTPMDAPLDSRRILAVARQIVEQHGWRRLFRGLNITVIRAFPVNGIIFPVYEYTLMTMASLEY
jgi:solute carrier family 25 carnitine/acylcarnitine transporter 20/29